MNDSNRNTENTKDNTAPLATGGQENPLHRKNSVGDAPATIRDAIIERIGAAGADELVELLLVGGPIAGGFAAAWGSNGQLVPLCFSAGLIGLGCLAGWMCLRRRP